MSNGDDKAVGALEIAADAVWQREGARRVLLANLGLIPMISRFAAVGARPATRFAARHLARKSVALHWLTNQLRRPAKRRQRSVVIERLGRAAP